MENVELLRDQFINPLNRTGTPTKAFFYDKDYAIVSNITLDEANKISAANPSQLFYIQDNSGNIKEFDSSGLNKFYTNPQNSLTFEPNCDIFAQPCGPPLLTLFGGGGLGVIANVVMGTDTTSILGFDIFEKGKNYLSTPIAELFDVCGRGTGASFTVLMEPYSGNPALGGGLQVKDILVNSPGNNYLSKPDGSFGGSGMVFKKPEEGLIQFIDGTYKIISPGTTPTLNPGDKYIPPIDVNLPGVPSVPGITTTPATGTTYPIVVEIGDVIITDPGFGYNPGDEIILTPDNGAIIEPIIEDGRIIDVNIINPGIGFDNFPIIEVESNEGYNFEAKILFKFTRLLNEKDFFNIPEGTKIISVVDCVGKVTK